MKRLIEILFLNAIFFLFCSSNYSFAQEINKKSISKLAEKFLSTKTENKDKLSKSTYFEIQNIYEINHQSNDLLLGYLVKFQSKGFIVLSNNKNLPPVIAYSLNSNFNIERDGASLLSIIKEDLNYRQKNVDAIPNLLKERNRKSWDFYLKNYHVSTGPLEHWPEEGTTTTGGWIGTTWHQSNPYNRFCPIDPKTNKRSVIGCGPLAVAQIVNYHRYFHNRRLSDQDKYIASNSINIDDDHLLLDFPSFDELNLKLDTLQFKYLNNHTLNNSDYASLCFTIGILTNVKFSSEGSSSELYDLYNVLTTNFNYPFVKSIGINGIYLNSLEDNMKNGLPAILYLSNDSEAHVAVCDGYNSDGFYHINFGWGTNSPEAITECWYYLDAQLPDNFVLSRGLIDIVPGVDETILTSIPSSVIEFKQVLVNKNSEVEKCKLRNNSTSIIYINEIKAPEHFRVSIDRTNYHNHIRNLYINPLSELELFIYSIPDSVGQFIETLEIKLTQNNVTTYKQINLHGYGKPEKGTLITEKTVSGSWGPSSSPYIIIDDVSVETDKKLTILPGITVKMMNNCEFIIGKNSQLIAIGNEIEPIYFTSFKSESGCNGLTFNSSGDDDILVYCVFTKMGNNEIDGGALQINTTNLAMNNVTFNNNQAAKGGAIYVNNSKLNINNASFVFNEANIGGAIYTLSSTVTLTKNNFLENSSTEYGGIFYSSSSDLSVLNSVLDSNHSDDKGSILSASNSQLFIKNITAVNYSGTNLDELFDITWKNNDLEIKNSIFWNNELSDSAKFEDLNFINHNTTDRNPHYNNLFNFNNFDANFIRLFQESYLEIDSGQKNISKDPKFINFDEGDFRLQDNSPCVDSGDPADDIGDEPYPHAFHINIGAFGGTSDACATNDLKLTVDHSYIDFGEQSKLTDIDNRVINFNLKNGCSESINITSMYIEDSTCLYLAASPQINFILEPREIEEFSIEFNYFFSKLMMFGYYQTNLIIECEKLPKITVPIFADLIHGTVIGGNISGTLGISESPYQINSYSYIRESLIIEPGVTILFNHNSNLSIWSDAKLVAKGTQNDSIHFIGLGKSADSYIEFYGSGDDDTLQYCAVNNLGSIWSQDTAPTISNTLFSNSSAIHEALGFYSCDSFKISNCRFENNVKDYRLLLSVESSGIIENTVFYNNSGICLDLDGQLDNNVKLQNLTIVENESPNSIIKINNVSTETNFVEIRNSIIGENRNPTGSIIEINSANSSIDFCNIDTSSANWLLISEIPTRPEGELIWGDGNISVDPMFINADEGNLVLQENSPCIDAGDPSEIYNDIEDPANTGFALWPARGTIRNDMGAFGGGVNNSVTSITEDEKDAIIPHSYSLSQNYPNPFNQSTVIKYSMPLRVKGEKSKVKNVTLKIFDILGREVATLVSEKQKPGSYEVEWSAKEQSSAIYFYRLTCGDYAETKKMILIK